MWGNPSNDELCDPVKVGQYLGWNLGELHYAAQLGYDGIGANEHRQNAYGFPMPALTASHLVASTQDLAIALIEGVAHFPHLEKPAEVLNAVDAFLQ